MSLRLNRLNEAIEHEVSAVLRTYFREESTILTVVGALISLDLRSAIVKYSVLGSEKEATQAKRFFSKRRNFIKQQIAKKLQLRNTPDLRFEYTDAIEKGNHLIDVLETIDKEEV